MFETLENYLINKKIIYLCADTHLYQHGIVKINTLKINQYVCGTGGAHQDYLSNEKIIEYKNTNMEKYELINSIDNTYGYLEVELLEDKHCINFKEVLKIQKKNYKEKYYKYKQKYLIQKNNLLNIING